MKRIFLCVTVLILSLSIFAQTAPIKFLGIPVDGKKSDMISALEKKGFEHEKTYDGTDFLVGDFNGRKSNIYVHTNKNIVDRIMVAYADNVDEAQIKIDYNNLLYRLQHNEKYMELENQYPIPDSEDISYEIRVNKKRYDSAFWVKASYNDEQLNEFKEAMADMSEDDATAYAIEKALDLMQGQVWFTISEYGYDSYSILIYYDNLVNQDHGEDL